jgi:hypothetical protein
MTGTMTLSGASQGLVSGGKTIGPATMTGTAAIGEIIDATLSSGDNTFQVPTGAVAIAFASMSTPTVTVKLRTNLNLSDAGLPISPVATQGWWVACPLANGCTEVILNAGGSVAGIELSFI